MPTSLGTIGLDEFPDAATAAVVAEPGFEPVAQEPARDAVEEAVEIGADGQVPAVADQPFDPPRRRLAIEPAPPGERRGLEQTVEGRAEPGEDAAAAMLGPGSAGCAARELAVAALKSRDSRGPAGRFPPSVARRSAGMPRARGRARRRRGRWPAARARGRAAAWCAGTPWGPDPAPRSGSGRSRSGGFCRRVRIGPTGARPGNRVVNRDSDPPERAAQRLALVAPPYSRSSQVRRFSINVIAESPNGPGRGSVSLRRRPMAASRFCTARRSWPAFSQEPSA